MAQLTAIYQAPRVTLIINPYASPTEPSQRKADIEPVSIRWHLFRLCVAWTSCLAAFYVASVVSHFYDLSFVRWPGAICSFTFYVAIIIANRGLFLDEDNPYIRWFAILVFSALMWIIGGVALLIAFMILFIFVFGL